MMKEATGEVSMTIVTLVAIAVIGAILASNWDAIKQKITDLWDTGEQNTQWDNKKDTP
mgnify:CR=1 FL=1